MTLIRRDGVSIVMTEITEERERLPGRCDQFGIWQML